MRLGRLSVWTTTVTLKLFLYPKQGTFTYVGLDSEYTKHSIAQGRKAMLNTKLSEQGCVLQTLCCAHPLVLWIVPAYGYAV